MSGNRRSSTTQSKACCCIASKASTSARGLSNFDIVVIEQFHDGSPLDIVVLNDQQSLRARRREPLETVECRFQAVGGGLLDEIGERSVRRDRAGAPLPS